MALLAAALSVALLLVGVVPPTAAAAGGSVGLHGSLAQTDAAELDRFWSRSVGSGRLINGVRADWQRHLRLAREKLGFTYIRAHGTLNSEFQISPAVSPLFCVCQWFHGILVPRIASVIFGGVDRHMVVSRCSRGCTPLSIWMWSATFWWRLE